ncbi:MAG: hypothetical protein NTW19_24975 [Planctomycetota bacterium]|nr:hypothetical protein [Planctomycetota bacterium]
MQYHSPEYIECWLCCIDLLGFRDKVRADKLGEVICIYNDCVNHLRRIKTYQDATGLTYQWFSDTFIIYSQDDSDNALSMVEQAGRHFTQTLVRNLIPLRGAITCGRLHSDAKNNIIIGDALIDAYEYSESQNWIGLVRTPQVYKKRPELGESLWYRRMPCYGMKTNCKLPVENVYAFSFVDGSGIKDRYLRYVEEIRDAYLGESGLGGDKKVIEKYNNTIIFIKSCHAGMV